MPYFETGGKLIFFAHVPKTGGSSVEEYLAARFGPLALLDRKWEAHWAEGGCRTASLRTSPQHITAEDAKRLLPRRPDWSFAVVRDPVARLVSEYRFQTRARRRRRRLTRFGFSTWLRVVLAAARREPTIFDNHLRPQTDFVPEGAEVFRLEDGFEPLITRLDAVTGVHAPDASMGHALKSVGTVPAHPSREDLNLISRAYAQDYARFGYVPSDNASSADPLAFPRDALGAVAARPIIRMYGAGRF